MSICSCCVKILKFYIFSIITQQNSERCGYGMAGGYFTDVVLHSSKNYHQQDATKLCLLSTDVADARGAVISRFHGVVRCGISVNESLNLWVWRASFLY